MYQSIPGPVSLDHLGIGHLHHLEDSSESLSLRTLYHSSTLFHFPLIPTPLEVSSGVITTTRGALT